MPTLCFFCNTDISKIIEENKYDFSQSKYECPICGQVFLTTEAAEDFQGDKFTERQKRLISICLRNEYESRHRKWPEHKKTLDDLHQLVDQYREKDPLEKLDNALLTINNKSVFVGDSVQVSIPRDYPYYHCFHKEELLSVLQFLAEQGYLTLEKTIRTYRDVTITPKGYFRLQELIRFQTDSRKCFVAMWFNEEMNKVYENAIKPGIEYIDDGQDKPTYTAVKIDNLEHVNDINDEIISQIRRGKFMVCDLTGYRGGVYFEAGFAYGLGMNVIYTCRKDWAKEAQLYDENKKPVETLFDENERPIEIKKEGVHFDLAHRNRIEWVMADLDDFRERLTNRIKASII